MKNRNTVFAAFLTLALALPLATVSAQEPAAPAPAASPFSVGADFYSNYIWRGSQFGTGPAFQPSIKFTQGVFSAGIWGSFDAAGYKEMDPFVLVTLPVGLSFGVTDYYYGGKLSEMSDTAGSHAFEVNLGFAKGPITLSANYILNKAGGAASAGGDKYFQVSYAFKNCNIFVGAGDGWHTKDPDKFAICNVGIGTSKTIKITDSFSIPVSGQIIVNPDKEFLTFVVGFSL